MGRGGGPSPFRRGDGHKRERELRQHAPSSVHEGIKPSRLLKDRGLWSSNERDCPYVPAASTSDTSGKPAPSTTSIVSISPLNTMSSDATCTSVLSGWAAFAASSSASRCL